jgi:hypothetical protein
VLLAWAVSCASYELRGDGTADIYGAGFDTFYVEEVPAVLELTVLVRLLLHEDEESGSELQMLGADTTPLGTLTFDIDPDPGPNHRPGYLVSQIEVLRASFRADSVGVYSVELFTSDERGDRVSEERRRSIFFNVRVRT